VNNDYLKQIVSALNKTVDITRAAQTWLDSHQTMIQSAVDAANKSLAAIPDGIFKIADWAANFDKAGLTPNLGSRRSIGKLKQYKRLLSMGYAIFWIPKFEVVDKLLVAKTEQERKQVVVTHRADILEDCSNVVAAIEAKYLKDFCQHISAAIDSMKSGNDRAAQATASICFDALLDQLIDSSALITFRGVYPKLATDGGKLKTIDNVPVNYIYAALQAQLVTYSMRGFERLRPRTVGLKFGRHSSIHSVSARQYNEFNALQAIMITTSLLATTNKLGKGWLTGLADMA
jgi:hypothetical protein